MEQTPTASNSLVMERARLLDAARGKEQDSPEAKALEAFCALMMEWQAS